MEEASESRAPVRMSKNIFESDSMTFGTEDQSGKWDDLKMRRTAIVRMNQNVFGIDSRMGVGVDEPSGSKIQRTAIVRMSQNVLANDSSMKFGDEDQSVKWDGAKMRRPAIVQMNQNVFDRESVMNSGNDERSASGIGSYSVGGNAESISVTGVEKVQKAVNNQNVDAGKKHLKELSWHISSSASVEGAPSKSISKISVWNVQSVDVGLSENVMETPQKVKSSQSLQKASSDGSHISAQGSSRKVKAVLEGDVDKTFFVDSRLKVKEAKEVLAKAMKTIPNNVALSVNGRKLGGSESLKMGEVKVESALDESMDNQLNDVESCEYRPKVIKAKHLLKDGTWKYSEVAVVHFGPRKQFIGGYRDKRTGQLYYHVVCQTDPERKFMQPKHVTREVQTNLPKVDFSGNTSRAEVTQTFSVGVYLPSLSDKIVAAKPYIPYNEAHKTMVPHRAAQIIQRNWRAYIMRQFVLKHFKQLAANLQERVDLKSTALKKVQTRRLQALTGACFPSFRTHFSDLLNVVSTWARKEAEHLANTKMKFSRKAALSEMLMTEQRMLYDVETQLLKAVEENLEKQDVLFLEGTARSRARLYEKGNVTIVDDLNIQKAKNFKEMLASYMRTDLTQTERLEILNCLQDSLFNEFGLDNSSVVDLVEILNQEIDLISIGLSSAQLMYLRKRFETKYLHLMRDPEVNPQAKYFQKTHVDQKKYALCRCTHCNKILSPSLMQKHVRMRKFGMCISCAQLQQNVQARSLNLAPYKRMLSAMRIKELEKNCRSSIPFLIQPLGIYFLVSVIWHGKSAVSGNDDLSQLRLTRWLPHHDWATWNTVVLTEKEAEEHDLLEDPFTHYTAEFILNVRTKNILGRMNYMQLIDIDHNFKFDRPNIGTIPPDFLLRTSRRPCKNDRPPSS